jgi:hypothetical protein
MKFKLCREAPRRLVSWLPHLVLLQRAYTCLDFQSEATMDPFHGFSWPVTATTGFLLVSRLHPAFTPRSTANVFCLKLLKRSSPPDFDPTQTWCNDEPKPQPTHVPLKALTSMVSL